ncbi:MAG TPA: hypothetical protein VLX28_01325 [Thermoanaerobaculia bacterium]|nr:hypothetical protein [Thermoanaerobaculia bacterium]
MAHVSKEALWRLAAGEAGEVEAERLAHHALACQSCRVLAAGHLTGMAERAKRGGPLKALAELTRLESEKVVESLLARAEWSAFRRLTRKAQKDRVIRSRACHSWAFLEVLLAALLAASTREESEFLASLASLAVQGMDARNYPAAIKNDFLGSVWTELGNSRRRGAEWHHADAALKRAEQYLAEGTGNPQPKARALSIVASLRHDQGHLSEALGFLEQCRQIYETSKDWTLVARTLVQMAYVLVDHEPERALTLLDKASPLIAAEDAGLRWLAATLRTEGLIESDQVARALIAFQRAESLRNAQTTRPDARLRSTFTAARLLEALGHAQEAERLFEDVIAGDLGHENYHVALLDFLYLFGFHVRAGAAEKAVEVSRRALAQLERLELGHDQLRVAWEQLGDAARRQALGSQALTAARDYLWIYWKHPAPEAPVFAQQEGPHKPYVPMPELERSKAVAALLARAVWFEIRALPRRAQQDRVEQSRACHSRAFLQVLLAGLRSARTQAETEFLASLAISAIRGMDSKQYPVPLKNDFLAKVWTEVANTRRIATDWHHAATALRKAEQYLAEGTGNPLSKARALSIAASLREDQGHPSEAVSLLEQCLQIYERNRKWCLVARTLVQMAYVLVDSEPERALPLLDKAAPLIPAEDAALRWLTATLRTEGLIETGQIVPALLAFQWAESLRDAQARPDAKLRSTFTAARLLEALGHPQEAELLFEEVIAGDLDLENYHAAILDFLYLFGFHIRAGSPEKAAEVSRRALVQLELLELGHDQLRAAWTQLRDAAERQTLTSQSLALARSYLRVYWKHPAPKAPDFFSG